MGTHKNCEAGRKGSMAGLPNDPLRCAFVIPVYNHRQRVASVVRQAVQMGFPVIVVDDGSTDGSYDAVKDIAGITLVRHRNNCGKGKALLTGMKAAEKLADWAISIDADGQHEPEDARCLLEAIPVGKRPIVVGYRMGMVADDVPWTSRFGRGFSNFWVRCADGPRISDSQCGFRIYPLAETLALPVKCRRFQFEIEVLVKAVWNNLTVLEAPVRVSYTPGTARISHFRPFVDFCRNFGAFSRLIFQRIVVPATIRKSRCK